MKRDNSMTLEQADELAAVLVDLLKPACIRVEIAGSVRRRKPSPNDIEIVCMPVVVKGVQLSFQLENLDRPFTITPANCPCENALDILCNVLLSQGVLEKRPDKKGRHCWGSGIKRAVFYHSGDYAPVDIFAVVGRAQWGVVYAIRTGPGDFNHLLVTSGLFGGACPVTRKVASGRVWYVPAGDRDLSEAIARMPAAKFATLAGRGTWPGVHVIDTPEEEDFLAALHVPWWEPEQRTVHKLRAYLQQREERCVCHIDDFATQARRDRNDTPRAD